MIYQDVINTLKICDMSDSNCDKCPYKDKHPNECIKDLHIYARHVLQECYEMAEFYAGKGQH